MTFTSHNYCACWLLFKALFAFFGFVYVYVLCVCVCVCSCCCCFCVCVIVMIKLLSCLWSFLMSVEFVFRVVMWVLHLMYFSTADSPYTVKSYLLLEQSCCIHPRARAFMSIPVIILIQPFTQSSCMLYTLSVYFCKCICLCVWFNSPSFSLTRIQCQVSFTLCNDYCWSNWQKSVNVQGSLVTIKAASCKHCTMITSIELYVYIPVSITLALILFLGRSYPGMVKLKVVFPCG